MDETNEREADAEQVLLRYARYTAREFAAAGICSAAGAETPATPEQLAQFDTVLNMIMSDACDQLRDAILRAYPACSPAVAEAITLDFLGSWGKITAAEGSSIARDGESGLQQVSENRERLLARLLQDAASGR